MSLYKIIIFLITYIICSINPAIIICKAKTGEDLRKLGSGDAGIGNAMNVLGKPLGIIVVILDVLKVLLSFNIVTKVGSLFPEYNEVTLKQIFIIASVIGHCFPAFYKFKGGKGVIVGITTAVMIDKKIAIVCIIVGIIVLLITRIVAMGTLCGLRSLRDHDYSYDANIHFTDINFISYCNVWECAKYTKNACASRRKIVVKD